MIEDTILFAKWEVFWFSLKSYHNMFLYDTPCPDCNDIFDYEMAQCMSDWFWPAMQMEED
jgi:hypothetical protein